MPCAASPPSTFCQEKVATSIFAQSIGCANKCRRGIGEGQPAAVGGDPFAVRHAHARGRAVPGEDDVAVEIDGAQIRQPAVVGFEHARAGKLQLRDDVGDPALAEVLPRQHVDAARAEHAPQRHLEGAGVGARHDGERDSRTAAPAAHASCRWRASAVAFPPANGASGRAKPRAAHPVSSRGAWRTDRKRSWRSPGAAWVF